MFNDYEKKLYLKIKNSDHPCFEIPEDTFKRQKLSDAIKHLSDAGYIIVLKCPEEGYNCYCVEHTVCSKITEEM